jgi:hypothetical protein
MSQLAEKLSSSEDQTTSQESMNNNNGSINSPITLVSLVDYIRLILFSKGFLELAKKNDTDFTRKRKLVFVDIFSLLINLVKTSTQIALLRFFLIVAEDSGQISVSQQAFSKARQKIRWESCQHLMRETVKHIYKFKKKTWRGYHLLAIDGSKIQLPSDRKLKRIFGTLGKNDSAATAQSSVLFDVLNGYVLDAILQPLSVNERTMAIEHLKQMKEIGTNQKFLVIFDRGYPSFELIQHCILNSVTFIMRLKSKFNCEIDKMGLGCHNYKLTKNNEEPINVRVIKFKLPNSGETETLITNLFDYSLGVKAFRQLYFKRWGIEVQYGTSKHKLEIENFSGRTEEAIYQDYYINILLQNAVAVAENEAQPTVDEERKDKQNKYEYKVNTNHAVGVFKDKFIAALLIDDPVKRAEQIGSIIFQLTKKVIPKRPNRSLKRNPCPRKANFHFNQKSNC